ncbi:MAG: endolytic transglycosylase MltG [Tahibacter sp.]
MLRNLLVLALIGAVVGGAWLYDQLRGFSQAPLSGTQTVEIAAGSSFAGIVQQLRKAGLTDAPDLYWRTLAEQMHVVNRLHAGEYAIPAGTSPRELLERMAAGDVIQHRITIVEGWTFAQLRAALSARDDLRQAAGSTSDVELMKRLDLPGIFPEGRFLPETYTFTKGDSDLDVLNRAHSAMTKALRDIWSKRAPEVNLSSEYEALILASIVERETGKATERPQIAGVFLRRLKIGMKLQTDPSVIYGLGASFNGNLRRVDLDTDTPYNSYTRAGLPPTPIALPGRAALEAVAHPASGDTLYFVARGDGSHEFSDSLEAHNRAVAKYQLHRNP